MFWILFPLAAVTLWALWRAMDHAADLLEKWWTS